MAEGRIIKLVSGFYDVMENSKVYRCRGRGVFRKRGISPLVGDFVEFDRHGEREGTIVAVRPRKNAIVRPPVANVDRVVLVCSTVRPEFSTILLDKFLVYFSAHEVDPVICVSKWDLIAEEERDKLRGILRIYEDIGYSLHIVSAVTKEGLPSFKRQLCRGTTVFAGQSGVGKSTLLNELIPGLQFKTGDVSDHLGRGRHTTRHVELVRFGEEGLIADTPGFSSLEVNHIEPQELASYFPEMTARSQDCKFRGCRHIEEPGCAVKQALANGDIAEWRYRHYQHLLGQLEEAKRRF